MFPETESFLVRFPEIWVDGSLVFEHAANPGSTMDRQAVMDYFGPTRQLFTRSGEFSFHAQVNEKCLNEVTPALGRRALLSLFREETRAYAWKEVEDARLEELTTIFFTEMGSCRIYTNLFMEEGEADLGGYMFNPVTQTTMEIFVCAINESCLAFWLYGEDN